MKRFALLFALVFTFIAGCRKENKKESSTPRRFAGITEDAFDGMVMNSSGEFVFITTLDDRRFVNKTTGDGDLLWRQEIARFHYTSTHIATNNQGEIFVMGTDFTTLPNPFVQIIKMDKNGEQIWTLNLKDTGATPLEYHGVNIICTADDQVMISLQRNNYIGAIDTRIYKITRNGAIMWTRNASDLICLQMAPTRDNGFLMVSASNEFHMQRYSSSGSLQWERSIYYPNISRDQLRFVRELENGNVVLAGKLLVDDQVSMSVLVYSNNGYPVWYATKNYLNAEDMVFSVTADPVGNIFAGGITRQHGNEAQGLVVKFNTEGKEMWHTLIGGPQKDYVCNLFVNSSNQLTVLGNTWNYPDRESIEKVFMLRMNQQGEIQ